MQLWAEKFSQVRRTIRCRYCLYACVCCPAVFYIEQWLWKGSRYLHNHVFVFVFGNWIQQSHSSFITIEFFPQSSTSWVVLFLLKATTIVCFSLITALRGWGNLNLQSSVLRPSTNLRYVGRWSSVLRWSSKSCIGQPVNTNLKIYIKKHMEMLVFEKRSLLNGFAVRNAFKLCSDRSRYLCCILHDGNTFSFLLSSSRSDMKLNEWFWGS